MMQGTLEDIHERASAACIFYHRYIRKYKLEGDL
jgi:predicted DNA binding CopG/RHH family protein